MLFCCISIDIFLIFVLLKILSLPWYSWTYIYQTINLVQSPRHWFFDVRHFSKSWGPLLIPCAETTWGLAHCFILVRGWTWCLINGKFVEGFSCDIINWKFITFWFKSIELLSGLEMNSEGLVISCTSVLFLGPVNSWINTRFQIIFSTICYTKGKSKWSIDLHIQKCLLYVMFIFYFFVGCNLNRAGGA